MNHLSRVDFLVANLGLLPHPEGGFYKETYRSSESIETESGLRNIATSIFFLLTSEHVSKFHQIKSDEHWYFHEGSSLTIHLLTDRGHQKLKLGQLSAETKPYQMVKADTIFGSSVDEDGGYALVSCAVAPGFDFQDFKLISREELLKEYPNHSQIISRLT